MFEPIQRPEEHVPDEDVIFEPSHYHAGGIDVIGFCEKQFTEEEFRGALKFNVLKYATRLGKKDDDVKDAQKCARYAELLKEYVEGLHD